MKMIRKRGFILLIFIFAFIFGMAFLTYSLATDGDQWVMKRYNHHLYTNGTLVGAGKVIDRQGDILAQTKDGKRVYSDSKTTRKSTLHAVGDPMNFISTGVQSVYDSQLTGYSLLFGVYNIENKNEGNDVKLTIDKDINDTAYKALNGRKGTVAVVNYKTGDIVCMVSSPSYDVEDIPSDINTNPNYEGVYINRFLSAQYVPGSTFKIVTSICAIENMPDVYEKTWNCNHDYYPDDNDPTDITCEGTHGDINFKDALCKSCNVAYAKIAIELGKDKLTKTSQQLGIGESISVNGKIDSYSGKFDISSKSPVEIGWTGVGQGNTRVAPVTMLQIVSAIANDGNAVSMNLVESLTSQVGKTAGEALNIDIPKKTNQLMSSDTASKMKEMMRYNVENNYGDYNYKGLTLCAKSGTAQIDENDSHNIAWFVGFMDDDENPYAFVVTVENGGAGSKVAGPIANRVLQKTISEIK